MTGPPAPVVVPIVGDGVGPEIVGGKGAWLDRLVAAGFPVPGTVVLSTDLYRTVAALPPLAELIGELVEGPLPPPEEHERERRRVDDAFAGIELPAEIRAAIADADRSVRTPGGLVAARSSATAEDLHGTSFAGQYRSFLGLADVAALERAVRLVWASLWHPAPRTYRRFHGLSDHDLAMAVIVMAQVPALEAGVAFTVDPGGTPDVVRVETVQGLGEGLVSGAVTPTVRLLPRRDVAAEAAAPVADGGWEVATLALAVEAALGEPQDLEWARDDEGLWLLQARPVTTPGERSDDGSDSPDAADRTWTTAGIVEMLPGVLPPLRFDVCRLVLEEAIRAHEARLGNLPAGATGRRLLGRVRGRAALDAALVDAMQRLGAAGGGRAALARTFRLSRVRRRALWEAGTATVATAELLDLLPEPAALDAAGLLALRRRVLDLGGRVMAAEVAVAGVAVADRLRASLLRHLDADEATTWAGRVTARRGGTVAGWPGAALAEALRSVDPATRDALLSAPDPVTGRAQLAGSDGGADLLARIDEVLRRAGSAAVFAGPTWPELVDAMWPALRTAVAEADDPSGADPTDGDAPDALDDLLDGLAADPEWRRSRILSVQVVDLRRLLIRRQAEDAADLLERRERVKSAVLSIGGAVRRIHLELGRRLVERGVLEEPADVELLREAELVAAVTRAGRPPTWAELARRRRWLAGCDEEGPLPQRFHGLPGPGEVPAAADGDVLQGWGAASGRLTGTARVLRHATDGGLGRGEVLVAVTTDASWAPLFMVAGAVVVEEGGPLSHAAIVARELGIPAVLNVPGVSSLVRSGDRVVVDGDAGTVAVQGTTGDPTLLVDEVVDR